MPTISWCSWKNVGEGRGLFRLRWKKSESWSNLPREPHWWRAERDQELRFLHRQARQPQPAGLSTWTPRCKEFVWETIFPSEYNLSPFCDLLVCPKNWVFYVDGVISHASQDQGLVESPHNKHCVVVLWEERGLVMNGKPRVSHQQHLILKKHIVPPSLPMASVLLRNPR